MTEGEGLATDLVDAAESLRARAEPFAFATIVRTAGTTAAKPGAKALIGADGAILRGFLGGGCTRGAVKRATLAAMETGEPQFISVAPEERLAEIGVRAGEAADGVTYARNGCPSQGTIDIFIEPCLPKPELVVLGASPVAEALAALAPQFHWSVVRDPEPDARPARLRVVIVATQGQGDLEALRRALQADAQHCAFVGSRKKFAALSGRLAEAGIAEDRIAAVSAPAGLNIGAVTPEEIALSILAEMTRIRRSPLERQVTT